MVAQQAAPDALARFEEAARHGVTALAYGPDGWTIAVQFGLGGEPVRCSGPTLYEAVVCMLRELESSPPSTREEVR